VSGASDEVQAQLRRGFASLDRAVARTDIPKTELAAAFGGVGRLLVAAELYGAAEIAFLNARALAPADMRWPYYLGHVFRFRSDQPNAETFFGEAVRLSPQDVPSLVWQAEMRLQQNRPGDAEPLLTKARVLDHASGGSGGAVAWGLGRIALERRDYAQAVAQFDAALALRPDATRIHYPLALAYRGLGQQEKADAHLRLRGAGDLPPDDPLMDQVRGLLQSASSHELQGSKAIEERRWDEAVAHLQKAVELAPAQAFTRLNLATSLYMSGKADAALEQYRQALRLLPALARAHFGVGVILGSRGQDAQAIDAFRAAVSADTAYVEARLTLANALRRTGRIEEALDQYDSVLALDPALSQAEFGFAMGLVRLGRYREARARLEAAATAYPEQPGFAHALARVLAAAPDASVRDGARAVAIMERLMRQGRSLATGETMAMALAEAGRFDDAVRWQREVIAPAQQDAPTDLRLRLSANLQRYQRQQACREPWPADDPVHRPQ
jgi:tetratricopeptide (TPR) repeat protein